MIREGSGDRELNQPAFLAWLHRPHAPSKMPVALLVPFGIEGVMPFLRVYCSQITPRILNARHAERRLVRTCSMLEILILWRLCQRIGAIARSKGRIAGGYQVMLVLFWFSGEIGCAILAAMALVLLHGDLEEDQFMIVGYFAGLIGAILAACLAFLIVKSLPEPDADEDRDWENGQDEY